MAKPKKKGGCFQKIVIAVLVLGLASVIFGGDRNDKSSTPTPTAKVTEKATARATSTPKPTATKKPTATPKPTNTPKPTKTPKPTATPTPEPTSVPLFSQMSPEAAAESLARYYADNDFEFKSVFELDGSVCIEMTLKPYLTSKSAVRDCCTFALNVSENLFTNEKVKSLVIYYDAAGRDAYGNETDVRAMEILINRATALKINYDYMKNHIWTSTKDFLSITDRYYVHRDLSSGVYE